MATSNPRVGPALVKVLEALSGGVLVYLAWSMITLAGTLGSAPLAIVWTLLTTAGMGWWATTTRGAVGRPDGLGAIVGPPPRWGPVLAAISPLVILGHAMLALYATAGLAPQNASRLHTAGDPTEMLQVAIAMIFLNPVLEELVFRGTIQTGLARATNAKTAILVSALLFALYHGETVRLPYYFVAGVVLGLYVDRTRSMWSGVVLHAAYNLVVVLRETVAPLSTAFEAAARLVGSTGLTALVVLSFAVLVWLWRMADEGTAAFSAPIPRRLRAVA